MPSTRSTASSFPWAVPNVPVTGADGKVAMTERKAGEASWSVPATHREENLNDAPFEVVAIEIKD